MDNLAEKETITIGPPARCARHDITLPGHVKMLLLLVICSNHHIWPRFRSDWCQDNSDSGCLRRKVQHKLSKRHRRFSGDELWKRVPNKGSSLHQGEVRRWLIDSATIHWDFQKMDFHNYVNKEITLARSNDLMMYARGKHTQLNIGWNVHPKYGLGSTINVRMMIH